MHKVYCTHTKLDDVIPVMDDHKPQIKSPGRQEGDKKTNELQVHAIPELGTKQIITTPLIEPLSPVIRPSLFKGWSEDLNNCTMRFHQATNVIFFRYSKTNLTLLTAELKF